MRKSIVGLCLLSCAIYSAFLDEGFAGFFDELIEKGKQTTKKEIDKIDKEFQKIITPDKQPTPQPVPSNTHQTVPASVREPGPPTTYGFSLPAVKKARGIPIINDPLTKVQDEQFRRYVDFLNPDSFEGYAECYAANYLPQADLSKYLSDKTSRDIAKGRSATGSAIFPTYPHTSFKAKFWKGSNEFETARARQAFIDENASKFQAAAIPFPVELLYIAPGDLGQYSFDEQKFNVGVPMELNSQTKQLRVSLLGLCTGERLVTVSTPLAVTRQHTLAWDVRSAEAEQILARVQKHQAYWGLVMDVAKPSVSTSNADIRGRLQGPPLTGQVKSAGLYEDLALERPLQMFDGSVATIAQASQTNNETGSPSSQVPAQVIQTSTPSTVQVTPPLIERLNGRPVFRDLSKLSGPGSQKRQEQLQFARFIDFIDVGTAKNLLENRAGCFLAVHLEKPQLTTYADQLSKHVDLIMDFRTEKFGVITSSGDGRMPPDYVWRGNNEFDRRRSKQSFIETYKPAFEASSVKLPLEIVVVDSVELGEYNTAQKGFTLLPHPMSHQQAGYGAGICGGLNVLSKTPALEFSKWELDPTEAETLIGRLPGRRASMGLVLELSTHTGESLKDFSYHKEAVTGYVPGATPIDRPWTVLTVKSLGLYEDPNIEKAIHMFEVTR